MRMRVTFRRFAATRDSFGQEVKTWADLYTCWGEVATLSGQELYFARQVRGQVSHTVTIRNPRSLGLTPKDQLTFRGRTFNIAAIFDPEERGRELVVTCTEVVAPDA